MARQSKVYEIIVKTNDKSVFDAVDQIVGNFKRALKNKPDAVKEAKRPTVRSAGTFPAEWKAKAEKMKIEFTFQDLNNGEKAQHSAMKGFIAWAEKSGFKAVKKPYGGRPGRPGWHFQPATSAPKKRGRKKAWE